MRSPPADGGGAARSLVVQPRALPARELAGCLVVVVAIVLTSVLAFVVLLLVNSQRP